MKNSINIKLRSTKKSVILFLMVLFIMPLSSMAQDIFAKYDGESDVTYINIKPKMFKILAKIEVEADDPETQEYLEMINSITSLKAIITEKTAISEDISTWVNSKSRNLEELMELRDAGTVVKFYIKEGNQEGIVEELLVFVNGISNQMDASDTSIDGKERKIETVIVSLTGNIDINKLNLDLIGEQVQLNESSTKVFSREGLIFKDFKIYPNPSQDVVTIDFPAALGNDINVNVVDTNGRQIETQKLSAENNTINVSNWQSGVYLIEITHNDSRIVKRFVKQ